MLHFVIKGVELGDFYFIDLSQENYAQKEEEAKNRIDGYEERNIIRKEELDDYFFDRKEKKEDTGIDDDDDDDENPYGRDGGDSLSEEENDWR